MPAALLTEIGRYSSIKRIHGTFASNPQIRDYGNEKYFVVIFFPLGSDFPNQVMELLEGKVGSAVYLEALTAVNMDILQKRTERKRKLAVEKATDPVAAAERRKERTEASKVRRRLRFA